MAKRVANKSAKSASDPLADAFGALREGDRARALGSLLAAWRARPSAQLAELIVTISDRVPRRPELCGKTAAAVAAWTALADKATPADLGPLLDTLADATSKQAQQRLVHVARWMPDPRVDRTIANLLHAIPYRATSTRPFWTKLFALARGITDRRQLGAIETATAEHVAVTMGDWLRARISTLARELADSLPPEPTGSEPELEQLLELGLGRVTAGTRTLETLLQAIHDTPDDDAPRLVYADALLERSDPRGELINLQITGADDRKTRKRVGELMQTHGTQWLGELAPVVMADYTFERGFLATCRVDNRHMDRVREVAGHPAWSTVRSISGSALIALHPIMRSLRELSFVSYEARGHEDLPDSWRDLLIGTPRPIEVLRYTGLESDRHWEDALEANQSVRPGIQGRWIHVPAAMELAALCSCSALPQLRELMVAEQPDLVADALLASDVIGRLDLLGFAYDARNRGEAGEGGPLAPFAAALRDAPVPRLRFELGSFHRTDVEFFRGDRAYRRVTMTVGPSSRGTWSTELVDEAIAILDAMPASVREVAITTRRMLDRPAHARLQAAVAQLADTRGLDSYEVR